MAIRFYKTLVPDRVRPWPVVRGPFRGAVIQLNPRHSLRKIFGIYEHELNNWIKSVVCQVSRVIDVGANDGYFTFGCAAAFRRLGKRAQILAFEPEDTVFEQLQSNLKNQPPSMIQICLYKEYVSSRVGIGVTTLNALAESLSGDEFPENTLIKMDVEGAELEVMAAAARWLNPSNYFLIEVHERPFIKTLMNTFSDRGLRLTQVDQRPLPILGYENRSRENWWLVSEI